MRKWVQVLHGRHPLFFAALVVVAAVALVNWNVAAGVAVSVLLGGAGSRWIHGRVGLAWMFCGLMAAGVFIYRNESRKSAEQSLLASASGEMNGCVLKDAKGGIHFWTAPVSLLTGRYAGVKVLWQGRGELPVSGSRVKANGNFSPLVARRNPGEFDQAAWLRGQGLAAIFHAGSITSEVKTGWWAAQGLRLRRGFRAAVTAGLDENSQEAVVIRAVVIGEQPPDADELVAAFRNSGTLHAFSVSGLHVAMVGSIGWVVLSLLGVPRRWAVVILLPLIFGYSWITGNSPPAVRSAWMAVIFLGAFITRRRPDLLNSLGAVLWVAMMWDGRLLFQPGVQLSYGVVAAIALGTSWASRLFSGMAQPELYVPLALLTRWQHAWLWLRRKVAQSLGVSVAASVGSTPLTVFHFGLITPVSILAGVIFVPLVFLLLSLSLLAVVIYQISAPMAKVVNGVNAYVAKSCVFTAEKFASLPGGHFQFAAENQPFLLVYDLGHGAGAACFSGGKSGAVLLDCGDRYSFKRQLAPSLRRLGISPDSVILSHPDGGHLGGGAAVWTIFPIRQVLLPVTRSRSPAYQAWVAEAPAAGIQMLQAAEFRELPLPDGARLEMIHTPDSHSQHAVADDRVAVFRLHWHGWKILFTSDAGILAETAMLDAHKDFSADVVIAGRHRSNTGMSDEFLAAANPQVIIASHSILPASERLRPETVSYWRSRGIQVIHQGESGGVMVKINQAGELQLEGFVNQSLISLKHKRTR